MPGTAPLQLMEGDRPQLEGMIRSEAVRDILAARARIVLLAADGLSNAEIARRTGASRPTVLEWRVRYESGGLAALHDLPRSGRPRKIDDVKVVVATLAADGRPPAELGVPNWSARLLGEQLDVSFATVARIWRKWNLQPTQVEDFRFDTEPGLDARVREVAGFYLNPPARAVVLAGEHALRPGKPVRPAPDPARPVATALAAAVDGPVRAATAPHPQEFLRFLGSVAAAHPRRRLHLVVGNQAAYRHPAVTAWLAREPRVAVHVSPGSAAWLKMVEVFFGIAGRTGVHRDAFGSLDELHQAITAFLDSWTDRARPFTWTAPNEGARLRPTAAGTGARPRSSARRTTEALTPGRE
jgi:transposase